MKVSIIGNGNVGLAVLANLKQMKEISEIALIGRSMNVIKAEIDDYKDANVLDFAPSAKLSYGGYSDIAGSDIIVYTAGAGQKPGQDRLDLVKTNASIAKSIFEPIKDDIKNAIIICVSNPVDIITYVIREVTGLPKNQVIGSGTMLDTARLRRFIAELFDIKASSVDCLAIGEHGMSSVVLWSAVQIANFDIDTYAKMTIDAEASMKKQMMAQYMKKVAYKLIENKGSTAYGVANATARVIYAIVHDLKEIMPVSTMILDKYGFEGSCVSIPCIVGRQGVIDSVVINMDDEEKEQFAQSVAIVKETIDSIM